METFYRPFVLFYDKKQYQLLYKIGVVSTNSNDTYTTWTKVSDLTHNEQNE